MDPDTGQGIRVAIGIIAAIILTWLILSSDLSKLLGP